MDPQVQRFKEGKGPIEVQMAEVPAVDVIQQVAQELAPLIAAVSEIEAGL